MEAYNIFLNIFYSANKYELSMERVLKCGKRCIRGDSIDKITLHKWSKIQTNAKEWTNLEKYGIQQIGRMVNKNVLCIIAVTSPCVHQINVNK